MKKNKYFQVGCSNQRALNARNSNKKRNPDGYIYFIFSNGLVKIGVSKKPERRFQDINNALPYPSKLIGTFWFKNVYEIEEWVHEGLFEYNFRKEWFKMDFAHIKIIMEQLHELSEQGYYLIRKKRNG